MQDSIQVGETEDGRKDVESDQTADQGIRLEVNDNCTTPPALNYNDNPKPDNTVTRNVPTPTQTQSPAPATTTRTIAIITSVSLIQALAMYPYAIGIAIGISIATSFATQHSTPPTAEPRITSDATWLAASYPLTQGTFVLLGGRLGAIYGHKTMLTAASAWWLLWQLVAGFAPNVIALCVFRALGGIGGGLITPNAVALLGVTFPPGKGRNVAFAVFGAMAPVGAAGGTLLATVFGELVWWRWAFFFPTILGFVVFSGALLFLPRDTPVDRNGSLDYIGAYLGVAGLILFNFVWNQAPTAGWPTPYIYTLLLVSLLHLTAFILWEAKFATSPILPFSIWKSPSFGTMILLIFCAFMGVGIWIWYFTLFGLNIRKYSLIANAAHYQPITVLGTANAFLSAWLVSRLSAQYILAIGSLAVVVCNILLATAPVEQTWWAQIFPSSVVTAFTIDFLYAASQIIASASVGREHQGTAGSLVGTVLSYGLSTGLGFAGTVEGHTNDGGRDLLKGYRSALYFGAGLGGVALVGSLLFLRVPKNTKEGWDDDGGEVRAGEM